jgi:purine-binding chemotaxis protein CheW
MAHQYVVFTLDSQRYALHLSAVDRAVHVPHITPVPDALDILLGIVSIAGRITPVVDIRRRFNLPEREISLSDRLIFARTERRSIALVADAVLGVIACSEYSMASAEHILPGLRHVEGIIKFEDDLILIHDLDKFFSLEEEKSVDLALAAVK